MPVSPIPPIFRAYSAACSGCAPAWRSRGSTTGNGSCADRALNYPRHCLRQTQSVCARELATKLQSNFAPKRRSNPSLHMWRKGLLRFARNDGVGPSSATNWRDGQITSDLRSRVTARNQEYSSSAAPISSPKARSIPYHSGRNAFVTCRRSPSPWSNNYVMPDRLGSKILSHKRRHNGRHVLGIQAADDLDTERCWCDGLVCATQSFKLAVNARTDAPDAGLPVSRSGFDRG
jgi:hypothetical protein